MKPITGLRKWRDALDERPLALSALAIAVAVAVLLAMASVAGFGATLRRLERASPLWLAVIVGAQIASYLGYTAGHRQIATLRDGPRLSLSDAFWIVAFGAAAASLGGGFSIDRRALRAAGAKSPDPAARVLGLGALEYAVLAPAAWVATLTLLGSTRVQQGVTIPWAVCVPLGFGLAFWLTSRLSARGFERGGRAKRALARGSEGMAVLRELILHPVKNLGAWVGMSAHWAAEILSLWVALRAFGVHASIDVVILAYATGYALTPRSLPLAGVGITEILMPLALTWVGFGLATAVVAVFTYRTARLLLAIPPALLARPHVRRLLAQDRSRVAPSASAAEAGGD